MVKKNNLVRLISVIFLISILPVYAAQPSQVQTSQPVKTDSAPVAVVKEPNFRFTPVVDGTVVTHDFIIENKGKAPLNIEKVKTSCGCTTADYTKVIQPQSQGKITINGNTSGYGGITFQKTISVQTDDPKQRILTLHITGEVERFVTIEPQRVFLRGVSEMTLQSVITITPEQKYPFKITESYLTNLENKIRLSLQQKDGKYILTVNNLIENQGRYWGSIHLKTNCSIKPEIVIPVTGLIKQE